MTHFVYKHTAFPLKEKSVVNNVASLKSPLMLVNMINQRRPVYSCGSSGMMSRLTTACVTECHE